jgi:hypothetical protein
VLPFEVKSFHELVLERFFIWKDIEMAVIAFTRAERNMEIEADICGGKVLHCYNLSFFFTAEIAEIAERWLFFTPEITENTERKRKENEVTNSFQLSAFSAISAVKKEKLFAFCDLSGISAVKKRERLGW